MKLLFDENISRRLIPELDDLFPGTSHVALVGLVTSSDRAVWQYARDHGFTIVTHDSDFHERSLIHGFPPKVLWLRTGNVSTANLKRLLRFHHERIVQFLDDPGLGCFQLFSRP